MDIENTKKLNKKNINKIIKFFYVKKSTIKNDTRR